MIKMNTEDLDRFLKNVFKMDTGCWYWMGAKSQGYGYFKLGGKVLRATRISYEHFTERDLGDLDCCHTCDNPWCVCPGHLYGGTKSQNVQDSHDRGRRNYSYMRRGVNHPSNKLTESQVKEIKDSNAKHYKIAEYYGINRSTVTAIKSGKIWRHI